MSSKDESSSLPRPQTATLTNIALNVIRISSRWPKNVIQADKRASS